MAIFFVVVLSVSVCVFLHRSASVLMRLSASCHIATCFFAVVAVVLLTHGTHQTCGMSSD